MQTMQIQTRRTTTAMATMLMTALSTVVPEGAPRVKSGYAPVNGLKMYYEIHGPAVSRIHRWSCFMAAGQPSRPLSERFYRH